MTRKEYDKACKALYKSFERQHSQYVKRQYSKEQIQALTHWKNDEMNRLALMFHKGISAMEASDILHAQYKALGI